jgi:hypothetical protein
VLGRRLAFHELWPDDFRRAKLGLHSGEGGHECLVQAA